MMSQSETLGSSHVIFITLFSGGAHHLPAISNCPIVLSQNHVPEPNQHVFFFKNHPILRAG
jgi:hypothetical protein